MPNSLIWYPAALGFLFLGLLLGCGKSEALPDVHPVEGRVLVQNKPVKLASVFFYPADEQKIKIRPRARTDADGRFKLNSYGSEDGAPAGDYTVTVVWTGADDDENRDNLPDRLQGRYSDPKTSPLKVTIKPGKNEVRPFQLK